MIKKDVMSALTGGKKKHTQVVDMEINEYSDEGSAFVIDRMNLVDLEWHSDRLLGGEQLH